MRDLKFRAWDIDDKQFIYVHIGQDDVWLDDGIGSIEMPLHHSDFEQYTGLKDKNGKEIYEGDIVKVRSRSKLLKGLYQVLWNEEAGGFECECLEPYMVPDDNTEFKDIRYFNEMHIEFEVIGNIHENKELLK